MQIFVEDPNMEYHWESKDFYLSYDSPGHEWEYVLHFKDKNGVKSGENDPRYAELKDKLSLRLLDMIVLDRGSRLEFDPAPWRHDGGTMHGSYSRTPSQSFIEFLEAYL